MKCLVCEEPTLDRGGLRECPGCGHIFQDPLEIRVRYDAAYLDTYRRYPTDAMSYLRLGFVKSLVGGGRWLDVGYGTGALVRLAQRAGFDAYGNDVHGVDCGVREVSLAAEADWDLVTFYDSLEHFPDFAPVRRLAARARWIVVSFPFRPERFPAERTWKHYKPGEHLHYFSLRSLGRIFPAQRLLLASDVEDVVRGKREGAQNICTAVFGP